MNTNVTSMQERTVLQHLQSPNPFPLTKSTARSAYDIESLHKVVSRLRQKGYAIVATEGSGYALPKKKIHPEIVSALYRVAGADAFRV